MTKLQALLLWMKILGWKRVVADFFLTFALTFILYALALLILGFDRIGILSIKFELISHSIIFALIISLIHWIFCLDKNFFRKFGFLLPEDITYYVFVQNKTYKDIEGSELKIDTPIGSDYIMSDPFLEDCRLSRRIDILAKGETKHIFLLLHTNKINKLIKRGLSIPYKEMDKNLKVWWGSPDHDSNCIDEEMGWMQNLYLLLIKNIIIYICKFMILIIILIILLYNNPPLNIIVDPDQITANLTSDQEKIIAISIKNIGCDLSNFSLSTGAQIEPLDGKLNSSDEIKLPSGAIKHIRLKIRKTPAGEYRGFITINASGIRHLPFTDSLKETGIKTIATIPYNIQISNKQILNLDWHISGNLASNSS